MRIVEQNRKRRLLPGNSATRSNETQRPTLAFSHSRALTDFHWAAHLHSGSAENIKVWPIRYLKSIPSVK
jgi:hypothetical protein